MAVLLHIRPCRERLADIGHVAHNGAEPALLAHLELLADEGVCRCHGRRPFHLCTELDP